MDYYNVISQLHKIRKPKIYLEIGVRGGESLQLACGDTKCIAIDPDYKIIKPFLYSTSFNKTTSDDYFERGLYLKEYGNEKIELAFIDGMHLFDFVIRDFINIEKLSSDQGMIILHDCLPENEVVAQRTRETSFWTGDVWKIVPILKEYRKDLKITILDSMPTGLVLVEGLCSESSVLHSKYDEIVSKYMNLGFKHSKAIKPEKSQKYIDGISLRKKSKTVLKNILSPIRKAFIKPKCLGVLMCYNDADILQDAIDHLLQNNHDIIIWNHGSTDTTDELVRKNLKNIKEYKIVPRDFDFYDMYPALSKHLIDQYIHEYDWISWPDQDEILEGPDRSCSYFDYLVQIFRSNYDWIQFNNYNFWFTEADDLTKISPLDRIKHYSIFSNCAPRNRSWRAISTNIRHFNHNPPIGLKYPINFNLRHYPMRTKMQMMQRINKDRSSLQRGIENVHYNIMSERIELLTIQSSKLNYDDGNNLKSNDIFNWDKIYKA